MTLCACPGCPDQGDPLLDELCDVCALFCVFPPVWREGRTREEQAFLVAAIELLRWRTHELAEGAQDHGVTRARYVYLHRHDPEELRRIRGVLTEDAVLRERFARVAREAAWPR